jgi:5-methylcytosine-specific restriction endonuclease McrA
MSIKLLNPLSDELLDYCGTYNLKLARRAVFEAWNNCCGYCGKAADTLDHIVPTTSGGISETTNLLPACSPCNLKKGSYPVEQWYPKHPDYTDDRLDKIKRWMKR